MHRKESIVTKWSDDEKRLLNEVLPNVAAQMRSPLGVLYVCMQKLVPPDAPGSAQMRQSYYQLLRLAGNLSAAELLSRSARLREQCNDDIVALCRGLVSQVQPLAQEKGIALSFSSDLESHILNYDRQMMNRLLLNLLSNALKFTPAGGTVTVSVQLRGQDVLLTVTDTGCGIAKPLMDTLFDRYLHSERMDPQPHGLGLGLPLCRAIAEAHGGRIFAESQVGKGTRVTVALPDERNVIQQVRDSAYDYTGGFNAVMMELSDALSSDAYEKKES